MSQGLTAPVSGAAQAAATRTARTSAGGSGPPGADSETPAFSSVLDHQVARTAHAEGQHKTTGESGGRRSSHGHGAGNGHHSHKSASAGTTTGGQPTTVSSATTHTHTVRAATPAVQQTQPTPVDTPATAESAILSPAAALPPASGQSDAVQPTAGNTAQTSNFIPATVKPAPAPVAPATPDVNTTAADQLSESGSQATTVPTDAGLQAAASVGAAAAPQTAQPTDPQTPQTTDAQTPQTTDAQTPQATDPQSPVTATQTTAATTPTAPAGEAATTVSGQAGAPTAKHSVKAAGPGAAVQGDAQTDSPTTTSATAQPQAPSAVAQDADQNGTGGQPQPQPNQAPLHASPADSQSQPEQAAPTQAANATAPTPGLAAGPTPQTTATAPTAATAAATSPARYSVGLSEAVETVKTTIELGARQGFSQAKIQLAPANLGQITIHLQKTSDGIVARVVADHSAAAQTMQQGGDDLRRSLQNSGLHLLRLDIETRGEQRGSANGGAHTSQSDRTAGDNDAAAGDDGASQPTTIVLPNGALVNVLA
jgi:flagellar hook-length control protein FliK